MSLFTFLVLLLRFLVPAPAAVAHTPPALVVSAPAPSHGRASAGGSSTRVHVRGSAWSTVAPASCPPGSSLDGLAPGECMADQLPSERLGREY